jgi:flagellar biogenesis protein FliO
MGTGMLAAADPSLTSALLRVVIVFVLLAATMRVMGRLTGRRGTRRGRRSGSVRRRGASRPIEVVGRQALNRGASVAIVEIDGRRLALGVTDQNVRLLADLTAADAAPSGEIDLRDEPEPATDRAPSLRALAETLRERPSR